MKKGLLRPDHKPGFQPPSGKVELYSTLREEWGLEPLPHYEEPPFTPASRPDLAEKYPLILSTGRRSPVFFLSEHRNIPWLREIDPDPVLEIHPDTAASLNISNGEWVLGGELARQMQAQGQGDPHRTPMDGDGGRRVVVPGKIRCGTLPLRYMGA